MTRLEQVKKALQSQGMRITHSRMAVATILTENQNSLLSSEEIFDHIKKSKKLNCDLVSVYRALTAFEKLGIVIKNIFQGEAAIYMLNSNPKNKNYHAHFFKCINCNTVESFEDCLVSRKEKDLEKKGYKNLHHHLEITGLCPDCTK